MKSKPERLLPFVFLNLAMSADGKIASANRSIPNFGSKRDKQHMMELRTQPDAIMSGARTVDLNSVTLGPVQKNIVASGSAMGWRNIISASS